MAVRSGKLPKSDPTDNGKQVAFLDNNKFNITSVFGLRKQLS